MSVNHNNYDPRGGLNLGIVARLPTLVGNRLVYFDHNAETKSWVIRDFIGQRKLDNWHSQLSITDIERDADMDEIPPWLNAELEADKWRDYLGLRTTAVLKLHDKPISTDLPNRPTDNWLSLP
jgi:hypothetical protein